MVARHSGAPVFVPWDTYLDDRGWSLMNLFQGGVLAGGQINYSHIYPGTVKAWHAHDYQMDFWVCLHGHIKVGVWDEEVDQLWHKYVGDRAPAVIIIPPGLWHGLTVIGPEPAGLLYYVDREYNPENPDERRMELHSPHGPPAQFWDVQHR